MAAAIEVRSVSKQFKLYHEHYTSLKERVVHYGRIPYEPFMALTEIDFDVEAGSTVGVLVPRGRNHWRNCWWGGWGSNPRPADYEKYGPALRVR